LYRNMRILVFSSITGELRLVPFFVKRCLTLIRTAIPSFAVAEQVDYMAFPLDKSVS
jgi:hypothetical protein